MPKSELDHLDCSTRSLLIDIWGHLSHRRRFQLCLLLIVMMASGLAELVSLGAVLPFLAVLSNPEQLWQQPLVQLLATASGFSEPSDLILPATFVFALATVFAALIRLANLWCNGRLAAAVGSSLSCEAYRRTLYQPYEVHVQRNSSSVISSTTTYIGRTVDALNTFLQLVTSVLVSISLFVGLIIIDAQIAIAAAVLFGSSYALLAMTVRRELRRNGNLITLALNQQLKALQEGLGAIRDILLDGNQQAYLDIYRKADVPQRKLESKNVFLSFFPRYALEALGLVGIALLGGLLVMQRGSADGIIPLLGTFALGAQRLLPALQQIYSGWARLKGYNASIQAVLVMLNQPLPPQIGLSKALVLREGICFEGVHFCYGANQPDVLSSLDLEIRRGERVGLIGTTGSGKSTMVDLLMGLLSPTTGRVLVDGSDLHDPAHPDRLPAWQASIAHVPQTIYLADSSIAENIAFGVERELIDLDRVKKAAQQAQIASFVESSAEGYWSFVGERGIRLSGGQRQRIGIARALYKQAPVLVLDEATSALDTSTEEAVMEAVEGLSNDLTVVMIAHRLSTVEHCDRIIRLENGLIVENRSPLNSTH